MRRRGRREKETDRQTETETRQRETDIDTETETERQTQTERDRHRHRNRNSETDTDRESQRVVGGVGLEGGRQRSKAGWLLSGRRQARVAGLSVSPVHCSCVDTCQTASREGRATTVRNTEVAMGKDHFQMLEQEP